MKKNKSLSSTAIKERHKKITSIGSSRRTRLRNKNQRRLRKLYRGQGR